MMAFTHTWDEAAPAAGDPANQAHVDIQNVKKSTRERGNVDHNASSGDDTDTWTHRENTAKIGQGLLASRPDAASANKGHMWYATDEGKLYVDTGGAWDDVLTTGYYVTGTCTVTEDSTTVEGAGSPDWTTCAAGDVFWISGATRYYAIASITDADTLELAVAYESTTAAGASYYIGRVSNSEQFVPRAGGTSYEQTLHNPVLATILDAGSNRLTSIATPTTAGDALIYPLTAGQAGTGVIPALTISTYTGNGVDDRDIEASVDLTSGQWFVIVMRHSGGQTVVKTNTMTDYYSKQIGQGYSLNRIQAGTATGFQVGTDSAVNGNGETYTYVILKKTA